MKIKLIVTFEAEDFDRLMGAVTELAESLKDAPSRFAGKEEIFSLDRGLPRNEDERVRS